MRKYKTKKIIIINNFFVHLQILNAYKKLLILVLPFQELEKNKFLLKTIYILIK